MQLHCCNISVSRPDFYKFLLTSVHNECFGHWLRPLACASLQQINESTDQHSFRVICSCPVKLDLFLSFPLMERTKDQARLTLPAHNEKPTEIYARSCKAQCITCFLRLGLAEQFSSVGSCEALYFTNSTALRAALPCKISSRFFILPAAGPLIARAHAPSPGLGLWFSFDWGLIQEI